MSDLTCVYYTGHRESPGFEAKIQRELMDTLGDVPLISVSQKPLEFGHNICVGNVGTSAHNAWRQLQIGAAEARTKYIAVAESDYLYPPDYFAYRPLYENQFCQPSPMYVLFAQANRRPIFSLKPRGQEGATIVGREFLLRRMLTMFSGLPIWVPRTPEQQVAGYDQNTLHLYGNYRVCRFVTSVPTITFKTDTNLHQKTQHVRHTNCRVLPHWGTARALVEKYLC